MCGRNEEWVECPTCHGEGELPDGSETVKDAKGRVISITQKKKTCPTCKGDRGKCVPIPQSLMD